jgi:hypothetical protein
MNNFKLEFINPGYGFRNYKIGEITVYTVRLRFKNLDNEYHKKILKLSFDLCPNAGIVGYKIKDISIFSYETTNYELISKIRKELWNICREHAQNNLDRKYSQLKLEL